MLLTATIHADASFSDATGRSGWAVWVKSEVERIVRNGACPDYVTNSSEAELAALFAGFHILSTRPWFPKIRTIYVRSDSETALRWMQVPPGPDRHPAVHRLHGKIQQILRQLPSCRLHIRHVRGHQGTKTRPGYVNDAVDKLSREARKQHEIDSPPAVPLVKKLSRNQKRRAKRRRRKERRKLRRLKERWALT